MANYYTIFPRGSGEGSKALKVSNTLQCKLCHVTSFSSQKELYQHMAGAVHRDWHRIRVQQRMASAETGGCISECVICDCQVPTMLLELHLKTGV